jgi:hypothetical protein
MLWIGTRRNPIGILTHSSHGSRQTSSPVRGSGNWQDFKLAWRNPVLALANLAGSPGRVRARGGHNMRYMT